MGYHEYRQKAQHRGLDVLITPIDGNIIGGVLLQSTVYTLDYHIC
jgi:formate/nitrite transporter FocA (FNT family)